MSDDFLRTGDGLEHCEFQARIARKSEVIVRTKVDATRSIQNTQLRSLCQVLDLRSDAFSYFTLALFVDVPEPSFPVS